MTNFVDNLQCKPQNSSKNFHESIFWAILITFLIKIEYVKTFLEKFDVCQFYFIFFFLIVENWK